MKLKKLAGDQVVQRNCLPASASKVPGGPVFSGQIFPHSLTSLLSWECVPTAQFHISSADIQIQDRLIVSSDGTCIHTLFLNSSLGDKLWGSLSVKIDAFSLFLLLFYSFVIPPEKMIY